MNKTEKLVLTSDKLYINKVERFIEQICDEYNIYNNYYANILLSVIEAYTNAVEHGNKYDENKSVKIEFSSESNGLAFTIEDQGDGFDINNIPDPTNIENEGAEGRGLFMINSLADQVEIENNGSKIKLAFLISSINREMANKRNELFHKYVNQNVKKEQMH
jgi:serine/threonine-protein kinase RsbW